MAIDIGTGTTLTLSGVTYLVKGMSFSGASRESIETTHLGTTPTTSGGFGSKTFIPGDLSDPGEMQLDILFDPAITPAIDSAAATATLTFAESGAAVWSFSCFVTGFTATVPLEALMEGTLTLKISGEISITP